MVLLPLPSFVDQADLVFRATQLRDAAGDRINAWNVDFDSPVVCCKCGHYARRVHVNLLTPQKLFIGWDHPHKAGCVSHHIVRDTDNARWLDNRRTYNAI